MLEITAAGMRFVARWRTSWPETAAFKAILPLEDRIIHCRWSGESNWIPWGDRDLGIGPENATSYPHPGELALYPGGQSETGCLSVRLLLVREQAGHLWANHFATLVEGQEQLKELGRLTLWEGAQPDLVQGDVAARQGRASSTYAVTGSSFPFILNPGLASACTPAGSRAWVSARSAPRRPARDLQPRARVDRVAYQRVRDVTVSSQLAHDRLAAVDADAQARPARMLVGEPRHGMLQGECRSGSPECVVGLVAAAR